MFRVANLQVGSGGLSELTTYLRLQRSFPQEKIAALKGGLLLSSLPPKDNHPQAPNFLEFPKPEMATLVLEFKCENLHSNEVGLDINERSPVLFTIEQGI